MSIFDQIEQEQKNIPVGRIDTPGPGPGARPWNPQEAALAQPSPLVRDKAPAQAPQTKNIFDQIEKEQTAQQASQEAKRYSWATGKLGGAAEFGLSALSRLAPWPDIWNPQTWQRGQNETPQQHGERIMGAISNIMPQAVTDTFNGTINQIRKFSPQLAKLIEDSMAMYPAMGEWAPPRALREISGETAAREAATQAAKQTQLAARPPPEGPVKPSAKVPTPEQARAAIQPKTTVVPGDIDARIAQLEAENAAMKAGKPAPKPTVTAQMKAAGAPKPAAKVPPPDPVEVARKAISGGIDSLSPEERAVYQQIAPLPAAVKPLVTRPETRAKLSLQRADLEKRNQAIIDDARRVLADPNAADYTKAVAREKLSEMGQAVEEAKPAPEAAKPKKAAPRQKLEDAEVAMSTFIKRQGGINIPKNLKEEFGGWNRLHDKSGLAPDEMAVEAHNAGLIQEPTTQALLDSLKSGRKSAAMGARTIAEADRALTEQAAEAKIKDLETTPATLMYRGKEYTGAVREGKAVRLKDAPDKVLKKPEQILQVEDKVPFDVPGEKPVPVPESELSPEEIAARDELLGRKQPIFEKTEAGMQARIPGTEGRTVPQKGLTGKGKQVAEPTPLEEAAKPKKPEEPTLYAGVPWPAITQMGGKFARYAGDLRNAARSIYSSRSVSEEAGLAQRLLTRRFSRAEEAADMLHEFFRSSKAILERRTTFDEKMNFYDTYERHGPSGFTGQEREIATLMKGLHDPVQNELRDLGLLHNFFDNHIIHQFDKPEIAREAANRIAASRGLTGPTYFLKQRRLLGTIKEIIESPYAQQNGLSVRYPNPVEAMEHGLADAYRLINGYRFLHEDLKPRDYAKAYREGGQPAGWTKIEGYRPLRRPIAASQQVDAPQIWIPSGLNYYAPDQIARVLNNYTRPGLFNQVAVPMGGEVVRPLHLFREITGLRNLSNLGASAFHAYTTAKNSLYNELGRGFIALQDGNPVKAAKHFAMSGTVLGPAMRDIRLGKHAKEVFRNTDLSALEPEVAAHVQQYIDGGGRLNYSRHFINRFSQDWIKNLEDRAIVEGANPLVVQTAKAVASLASQPIYEHIVGPGKVGAFIMRFSDWLAKNPGADVMAKLQKSSEIMDVIDDSFGLVNYDRQGTARWLKDSMFMTVRAPGWRFGNLKNIFLGQRDLLKGLVTGKPITERSASFLGMLLGGAYVGTLFNLAFNGKLPDVSISKPFQSLYNIYYPESGGINPDGTPSHLGTAGTERDYLSLMFNVAKPIVQGDPIAAYQGAAKFVDVGLNPLFSDIGQLRQNKDYYNRQIVDPTQGPLGQLGDIAKWQGKQWAPFSVQNLWAEREAGVKRPWWQGGWTGFTPPMSEHIATESKAMRNVRLNTQIQNTLNPIQAERVDFHKQLYSKLANNEPIDDLLKSGNVTGKDIRQAMKRLDQQRQPQGWQKSELQRAGLAVIIQNAKSVTAEEAPMFLEALDDKMQNVIKAKRNTPDIEAKFMEARKLLVSKISKTKIERFVEGQQ